MFLTYVWFPSAFWPIPSGTFIKVTITVWIICTLLFMFSQVSAKSFVQLGVNNPNKVHTFTFLFFGLGLSCIPMIFNWSAVCVKATTFVHIVALVQLPMILAQHKVFIGPAKLLGFLGNMGVDRLHLVFPFSPIHVAGPWALLSSSDCSQYFWVPAGGP